MTAPPERLSAVATGIAVETARLTLSGKTIDTAALADEASGSDSATAAALAEPAATFVTIRRLGQLRGCIGSLLPRRVLIDDVVANTGRSLRDPRLSPVTASEWPQLWISVSLLTAPRPLEVDGLDALLERLRPEIDGLTLRAGDSRATFLPTVWETLRHPRDFVDALFRKGGWTPGEWPQHMRAEVYQTHSFASAPPRPALEET